MILAALYDPLTLGTHEPRVYVATQSPRYWRIVIEWSRDGEPVKITVSTADKMRLSEAVEAAREELAKHLRDGEMVDFATMRFWCGK